MANNAGLLVRAPNHLGDFVMALPSLYAASPEAVMVPDWLEPLASFAGFQTLPFDRGNRGFLEAVRSLRERRFDRGVLLTPSLSSAFMLRAGNVNERRGTDTDYRTLFLTDVVPWQPIAHQHRASIYMLLTTGVLPAERPLPQLPVNADSRLRFRDLIGTTDPLIGIVPGSNAPSRTWPADRFTEVADQLSRDGRVVVFGSAQEADLTRQVARDVAIDLGGRTTLPMLAAGLAECELVVSNDTGPLHLATAVGTRTISIWGAGNPGETGPPQGHPNPARYPAALPGVRPQPVSEARQRHYSSRRAQRVSPFDRECGRDRRGTHST